MTDLELVLYTTMDPEVQIGGRALPAMTTMLHRVCQNDPERFAEACRIIELFVGKALSDRRAEASR